MGWTYLTMESYLAKEILEEGSRESGAGGVGGVGLLDEKLGN